MTPLAILGAAQAVLGVIGNKNSEKTSNDEAQNTIGTSFAQMMQPMQNLPSDGQNGESANAVKGLDALARKTALFQKIDKNGDGQISKEELKSFKDEKIREAKNAMLELQEAMMGGKEKKTEGKRKKTPLEELMDAVASNVNKAKQQAKGTEEAKKAHGHHQGHASHHGMIDKIFARLDADSNGTISKNEFLNPVQPAQASVQSMTATSTSA